MRPPSSRAAGACRRQTAGLACLAALIIVSAVVYLFFRPGGEPEWRPGTPLAKKRVKIGVIYTSDAVNEKNGYSHAHEVGVRLMQRELGIGDEQVIRKTSIDDNNPHAAAHAIRECIAAGANIIIATSWNYMETCEKLAGEHPHIVFAHGSGHKYNSTNFTNYFGRIYQARYLSGIIAGLRTATGKIGYVAAMDRENSEVTGGINAFALGVESVNSRARVYVRVTHRWFDPLGEIEAAKMLIAEGCDVLTQHCDTSGPQIAAQEAGVWSIGYNSDMRDEAPEAVLTSTVWNWGVYYSRLVRSVLDGTFTTEPYFGGLNEGVVGLAPFNEGLLPAGAAEAVAEGRRRIESGEFDVFDGVMETNDGRTVGEEGGRLADAEIWTGLNWYYRNVVEVR